MDTPAPKPEITGPVLFFDGTCGLCQRAVRFLLRRDRRKRIRFGTLQGKTAQDYLRSRGLPTEGFESMIWVPRWENRASDAPLYRTDGALAALALIDSPWRKLAVARHLPAWLRDPVYRVIGRLRFALFGPARPGVLSRPEWADRFLP